MAKVRNRPTEQGRELGAMMAKWCDDAEPKARLRMPELPVRCNSCAFRDGPHTANGSPETQMDVLKCLMEGVEFYCHEPARDGHLCAGWATMMLATEEPSFALVPWGFSDELGVEILSGGAHDASATVASQAPRTNTESPIAAKGMES